MSEDHFLITVGLGMQAGMSLVLALLVFGFYRVYRHMSLPWWAAAWLAGAVHVLTGAFVVGTLFSRPAGANGRLALTYLSQVALYLQIALILAGAVTLAREVEVPGRWRLRGGVLILVMAAAGSFTFLDAPPLSASRFALRVGMPSLIGAVVFLAAAMMTRQRPGEARGIGRRTLAGGLAAFGLMRVLDAYYAVAPVLGLPRFPGVTYLGFSEVLAQAVIGISILGWLLEDERNRAEARTVDALRAEATRREQERKFRALIENATDVVTVLDVEGRMVYQSPSVTRLFGYHPHEMIGRSAFEYIHPDDQAQTIEQFAQILANPGEERTAVLRFRGTDGSYRVLESCGKMMPGGESAPEVVVNSREITDRLRAEEARRSSEERLARHLADTPMGVVELDPNLRVQEWNPAAGGIFGWPREAIVGKEVLLLAPEDQREAVQRQFSDLLRTYGDRRWILPGLRRDGRGIECEWVASPVRDEVMGSVRGIACFVQDVTEKRQLERQMAHAQRIESVGRLAGGVAHDFNNLLTAILGSVSAVRDHISRGDSGVDDLATIEDAAGRAAALTRQLLTFSRQQVVQPRVLDLHQLTLGLAQILRRVVGESINVETRLAQGPAHVLADPLQVEQVILNLVVNARDAMPLGGRLVVETERLHLSSPETRIGQTLNAGDYITLTVRDSGSGIREEVQAHLFEPFFSTKPQGQGTGLGLATCYGIVRQHGGAIWYHPNPGGGSAFSFCLPTVARAEPAADRTGTASPLPRGSELILIAEDEAAVRGIVSRILQAHGYEVLEAGDGIEALRLIREARRRPDLVVTDVVMPGLAGPALAERLREEVPELRVVFTSGYAAEVGDLEVLSEPGMFLPKPFTPGDLVRFVRQALDAARVADPVTP